MYESLLLSHLKMELVLNVMGKELVLVNHFSAVAVEIM